LFLTYYVTLIFCLTNIGREGTGNSDGTVKLWEISTGKEIRTFSGNKNNINSIVISGDGKYLVTGSFDNKAKLWEISTGKEIRTFSGHSLGVNSVAMSSDGKYLATGSADNTAKLWEISTGKEIRTFSGHTLGVNSVAISSDGKNLVTGSYDRTTKLWDIKNGSEVVTLMSMDLRDIKNGSEVMTLMSMDFKDYLITTPDNYYTGSKKVFNNIAFRVGNSIFSFEQFDLQYDRPDIVLERIGLASKELIESYHKAYQKRLLKMKITENMFNKDFHVPQIKILTESIPFITEQNRIIFRINAKDDTYLLNRINVYVNGVPVYGTKGVDLTGQKVSDKDMDIDLELNQGNNKVQVSALNEKGAESLKESFEINYAGENKKPNLYIVAVSVSNYKDNWHNLVYSYKDGQDFVKLFTSKEENYKNIYVDTLFNENATLVNFNKLKAKLEKSNVDDEVLVYFSGHGLLSDSLDFYYASYDMDFQLPQMRGISYDAIEELLDGIPARKKVLFLDACHSGELDKEEKITSNTPDQSPDDEKGESKSHVRKAATPIGGRKIGLQNSFELMSELFTNLNRGSGTVVISASSGIGYALESKEWDNGVFTYAILNGLKNKLADLNNDGIVTISELKEFVSKAVEKLSNGKQKPTSRQENIENDFTIWK
jgi:hypothetical protein